jgi:hypothetical protein
VSNSPIIFHDFVINGVFLVFLASIYNLEKGEGWGGSAKGTNGFFLEENWVQSKTLQGKNNLKSPYLENKFEQSHQIIK